MCQHNENISIVNWRSGELESTLIEEVTEESFHDVLTCFSLNPSAPEIAVSTKKGLLKIYSLEDRSCIRTMKSHIMPVLSMCYDPTGVLVATGSADRSVRVWDVVKGHCTHSFKEHTDIVQRVYFHPNPNKCVLFSSSDDNTIRCYDLLSSSTVACFKEHMSLPTALSASISDSLFLSVGRDKVSSQCYLFIYSVLLMYSTGMCRC